MKKIYYGLFFLLPLLGCRSTAPKEAVETIITIPGSDRPATYDSEATLWGASRSRAVLDTVTKSSVIIDTIATADVYSLYKGWNSYRVYIEPGDHLTLDADERGNATFKGDDNAVLRNQLLSQVLQLQEEYTQYRREFLRCKNANKTCKRKEVNLEETQKKCTDLVDQFVAAKKGVTPGFERFLKLNHKYFIILNSIEFPAHARKSFHQYKPEEIKLMEKCSKDAQYKEACLSFPYRQVLKAYVDYLRIADPLNKCKYGKEFVKNELALSEYFKGEVVQNFVKAHNLASISYECAKNPAVVEAVNQLTQYKDYVLSILNMGKERLSKLSQEPVEFPAFTGEDVNGQQVSLKDFKGKYVLIDVWATWCGVCQGEFKYTNAMEPYFEGKDVVFLGVSVDKESDHDKWIRNIEEKELKGVQINLKDPKERDSFVRQLGVTGYPHYALIGPDGKLVMAKLPKPSTGVQYQILNGYLQE